MIGLIVILLCSLAFAQINIYEGVKIYANNSEYVFSENQDLNFVNISNESVVFDNTTFSYKTGSWDISKTIIYPRSIVGNNSIDAEIQTFNDNVSRPVFDCNGSCNMFLSNDTFTINGTSANHVNHNQDYVFDAASNLKYIYFAAEMFFNIYDEITLNPFNVTETQSLSITVFCTNQTALEYNFTTYNISANISCSSIDYVKIDVSYNDSAEYFRTNILRNDVFSYNFYLINLINDIAIQSIINLVDLTGEYGSGHIVINKPLYGLGEIISQKWDFERNTNLYLIKDNVYEIAVVADDGSSRSWGNFIPESAEEHSLTLPVVEFYDDDYSWQDSFDYGYNYSDTGDYLKLRYNDNSGGTESVVFTLYNATNLNQSVSVSTLYNSGTITFSLNPNMSYYTELTIRHIDLDGDTLFESEFWSTPTKIDKPAVEKGWSASEYAFAFKWFVILLIIILTTIASSYQQPYVALFIGVFFWIATYNDWITTGNKLVDGALIVLLGIIAVLGIIRQRLAAQRINYLGA